MCSYDQGLHILATMPAYFKSNGYHLPKSRVDGPFQFAFETTEDCYTYWSKQPGVMERFNTFMQGLFGTPQRLGWADWFPLKDVCLKGFDASQSEYVFVDVGGGKGHESELVLKKYPETKGKLVVQDLPFVIDDISELDYRVERMKHDFTQAQPILGIQSLQHLPLSDVADMADVGRRADILPAEHPAQLGITGRPSDSDTS